MIPDWQTNHVLFSNLLPDECPGIYRDLCKTLDSHGITHELVPNCKNKWIRDFYPLQVNEKLFARQIYRPWYEEEKNLTVIPLTPNMVDFNVILDGGNVISDGYVTYLTERIYEENPDVDPWILRMDLADMLDTSIEIIPCRNRRLDMTGHADGVIRFLDEKTLLCNEPVLDILQLFPYWRSLLAKLRERYEPVFIPRHWQPDPWYPWSAVGNYINFLRVDNLIVLPGYGIDIDEEVKYLFHELAPTTSIHQIDCTDLARDGGVLNCVTATIRK